MLTDLRIVTLCAYLQRRSCIPDTFVSVPAYRSAWLAALWEELQLQVLALCSITVSSLFLVLHSSCFAANAVSSLAAPGTCSRICSSTSVQRRSPEQRLTWVNTPDIMTALQLLWVHIDFTHCCCTTRCCAYTPCS
jgi:hypothetical protein